jgi:hypothetical protein
MNIIHPTVRFSQLFALFYCLVIFPVATAVSEEKSPPQTPQPVESKTIAYVEVVTADGLTKDQLYSTALAWFGETFRSAKNVIEVQDREAGRIIAKPLFPYEPTIFMAVARIRGVVRYSVTVEVKDGRYRYTIDGFVHEGSRGENGWSPLSFGLLTTEKECPVSFGWGDGPSSSGKQETWEHLKSSAKNESDKLIASLKSRMAQPATKTDNW